MCDTLVALPKATAKGHTIFGKNSDRPHDEVQLITSVARQTHKKGEEVQCTYISIPQVEQTYEIILSQPYWMWGAEMGANEFGVAIGNEAVYTKEELKKQGLLGMDLLRLGLERAKNAQEALSVITELLEKHGQGGDCAYEGHGWYYHNSYLIADPKEAYVLETADDWWVAEKVENARSISNNLSIRGKGDLRREGIVRHAIEEGYCQSEEDFDFARSFSQRSLPDEVPLTYRQVKSKELLEGNIGDITVDMMMEFLREHEAGLCMHGQFQTTGSQVSELKSNRKTSIHWFTGSSKPCLSMYKPYVFPINDQKALDPGPYKQKNEEWYWIRHQKFINPFKKLVNEKDKRTYVNEMDPIERNIYINIQNLVEKEDELDHEDFEQNFYQINQNAWQKAYDLII